MDAAVSSECARHLEMLAELEADRMDKEAGGLCAEISHLARMNGESAVNDRMSRDVERLQGRMCDAELEHVSRREMLERDLDKERELAALKEQRAFLAEDRCGALTREMTELKELAREATEGATAHAEEARVRANKDGHPNLR